MRSIEPLYSLCQGPHDGNCTGPLDTLGAVLKNRFMSSQKPKDPEEVAQEMAERIREGVKKSELSFAKIGKKVGVTRGAVHQWTKTGYIKAHHLPLLADVLGVTVEFLLTGRGETPADRAWLEKIQKLQPDDRRRLRRFTDALHISSDQDSTGTND